MENQNIFEKFYKEINQIIVYTENDNANLINNIYLKYNELYKNIIEKNRIKGIVSRFNHSQNLNKIIIQNEEYQINVIKEFYKNIEHIISFLPEIWLITIYDIYLKYNELQEYELAEAHKDGYIHYGMLLNNNIPLDSEHINKLIGISDALIEELNKTK